MPRGGVGGCSPPGKFRPEKISKGKFNPPSNFGNFQLASPWREVVWASLFISIAVKHLSIGTEMMIEMKNGL